VSTAIILENRNKLINTTVATFIGDTDMKMNFSEEKTRYINTMSLTGLSLMWGQMLGMLNPWFTPLTVLTIIIGYGSELNKPATTDSNLH